MGIFNLFTRSSKPKEALATPLAKTRASFWGKFTKMIAGKASVDAAILDSLEELLIAADVGVATTVKIIAAIEQRVAQDKYLTAAELDQILKSEIERLLHVSPSHISRSVDVESASAPHVILVVGVNGVGKTTAIGKLAARFIAGGGSVTLGAADTFRAAAVEQLTIWGNRVGATVVSKDAGADPSSVAYEAVRAGIAKGSETVIIDTAGRLHTKVHLIHELSKIKRTIQKLLPAAPQEILLVLDGTTGQNAFLQAEAFTAAVAITGIIINKLDGTSKGGVVLGIADQFSIPIKYIGVGEKVEDLHSFDAQQFVESLFQKS